MNDEARQCFEYRKHTARARARARARAKVGRTSISFLLVL